MKKFNMYYLYILVASGLIYIVFLILIPKSDYWIDLPVSKVNSMEKVVQYKNATIMNTKVLSIENPNLLQKLVGPGDVWYDPIYVYYLTTLALIFLVFFKNYNIIKDGFTPKALKGIKVISLISMITLLLHVSRDYWFSLQIREITSNEYHLKLKSIIFYPEFYLGVIFGKLMMVFKRGLQIDQEQQLTI